jgi:hypothetical protein
MWYVYLVSFELKNLSPFQVQDEKKLALLVHQNTMVALRPPSPNCQTTTRYVCRKANFADGFCQRQLLLVRSTPVKVQKADSDEEEKQAPKKAAPQQQKGKVANRLGMMYFRNYHKSTELDEESTFPVARKKISTNAKMNIFFMKICMYKKW